MVEEKYTKIQPNVLEFLSGTGSWHIFNFQQFIASSKKRV